MRHRKKSEKFSRPRAQRKALIKALIRAVLISERIVTTTPKVKYIKAKVDRIITLGKKGGLARRRLAYRTLGSHTLVNKLFDDIAHRFSGIQGGYTRTLRLGQRKGDGASTSLVELTVAAKDIAIAKPSGKEKKSLKAKAKVSAHKKEKVSADNKKKLPAKKKK